MDQGRKKTNVVLVLADDMGYSDLGCYGGEIRTPVLDNLGRTGVRLSSLYNTARCSPSRASLLTGLHPHQTGIGILTKNDSPEGYPGSLNDKCVTMAEVLRSAGYRTGLVGKWHLCSDVSAPNDAWPTRRGFDEFWGTLSGCGSYYQPQTLHRGESDAGSETDEPDFFYTQAITAEAERFIRSCSEDTPFFLFVSYTAPHWPLHARDSEIAEYDGVFDDGWDELRDQRIRRSIREGVLPEHTELSDRDSTQPRWEDEPHKKWQARRMQVYAAQVSLMDEGIGRIVESLRQTGQWDNTLFLFLSDNGASAEGLLEDVGGDDFLKRPDIASLATRDGDRVLVGNSPDIVPGPENTYSSYGRPWANLSNTPFRFYKRWVHEGGIATPLIAHWPNGRLSAGTIVHTPFQLVDILPTVLEATRVDYPEHFPGRTVFPLEGRSMVSALQGGTTTNVPLYWEHIGNAALRDGPWKIVREYPHEWELYNIDRDRTELHNVAGENPDVVARLTRLWQDWANRVGVIPWEDMREIYRRKYPATDPAIG